MKRSSSPSRMTPTIGPGARSLPSGPHSSSVDGALGDVEALADRDEVLEHLGDQRLVARQPEQAAGGRRTR